jgi:membrane protein DedA with SNARE-associated domain
MNPKSLLSGINITKLALDSLSGYIVIASLMFIVDSLIPGRITENLLTDSQAGTLTVIGLIIVVSSAILGLLVDSIFHTFGRWFAKSFWKPLKYEFEFRNKLMKDLGLGERDFEWIQTKGTGLGAEVEDKFLRFTEVAGSSAYAMFLLSIAMPAFLVKDYGISVTVSLWVAFMIVVGAVVLLYTSAASLSKYEKRKTGAVLDDFRKLTTYLSTSNVEEDLSTSEGETELGIGKKEAEKRKSQNPLSSPVILWPLLIGGIMCLVFWSILTGVVNPIEESEMITISKLEDNKVPFIDLSVSISKDTPATPGDKVASKLVTLDNKLKGPLNLKLVSTDVAKSANLPENPKWGVKVGIGNAKGVVADQDIYINALLSLCDESGERLGVVDLYEGDWILPVVVSDDNGSEYLLAYIKVAIKWE